MKLTRFAAFILMLLVCVTLAIPVYAEESGDTSVDTEVETPDYDYVIKYGYKPLQAYDGATPADYIKGVTPKPSYVNAGDSHVVSDNYYRWRDYVFVGWRAGGKLYKPGEVIYNISSDITFTAEWARPERPQLTVHGILSYSKNGKVVETVSAPIGQSIKLKEGEWQDKSGRIFTGGSNFLMSFTSVDFAEPTLGYTTATVKYNGDGVANGIQSAFKIKHGSSFIVDGCYGVKEGYAFSGWFDGKDRVYLEGDTCVVNGDLTLTALWRENEKPAPNYCTVTLSVGEGGSSVSAGKSTIEKGKKFTFTVQADNGYKLISVICDGAELGVGGNYTLTVNADMNINVSFEKLPEEAPIISEEEVTSEESIVSNDETSENAPASKDESGDAPIADDEKDGSFTKIIVIAVAAIICIGGVAIAAKTTAKNKRKR